MREGHAAFDVVRSTDGSSDWHLVGQLDLATAGDLSAVILSWFTEQSDGRPLTLDVSELTFIDSTGVRTLYGLTGPPRSARLILRNPTEAVRSVLGMLGLASDAEEVPTDVAIEHLGDWESI